MYIVHLCKIYNFFRVVAFWSLQNGEGEGGEVESLGQVLINFRLSMIFKMWASCSFSVIARGTTELPWIRALKWCVCVWGGGGQKPQKYNIKTSLLLPIPYFETINRKGAVLKKKIAWNTFFLCKVWLCCSIFNIKLPNYCWNWESCKAKDFHLYRILKTEIFGPIRRVFSGKA